MAKISGLSSKDVQFWVWSTIVLLSLFIGIITEQYFLAGFPGVILIAYLSLVDFKKLFYLLLICLPISTEIILPNGFGTDLPTEPLTVGLMFIFGFFLLQNANKIKGDFFKHPLTLMLYFHLFWILITSIVAQDAVSIKFLLAKCWYIAVFYFLAGHILKSEIAIRRFFWCVFIPLSFTVLVIMVRHAGKGFSFQDINRVLGPFYRNHVSYAALLALFFPIICLATNWYERRSKKWWLLVICIPIYLAAIWFTYTRAAYIGLILAAGAYIVVRFRLMKIVLLIVLSSIILGVAYISYDNHYLDYAPDYNKTISHQKFGNLLEATYKGEDISTMERVHRWVAGGRMSIDKPFFGFGPGNFYNFYRPYTVTSFTTYVSGNPEKSGIHSYYLMTLVEQGLIGLLIFIGLNFYTLLLAERVFHESETATLKNIVLMATLAIVVIDAMLIINDLIETDKVGSFFFICMAILVKIDIINKRKLRNESPQ